MDNNSLYTCRICLNSKANISYLAKEMMLGTKDEFVYFQCSKCNCLQIAAFPEHISSYYPADSYYSFSSHKNKKLKGLKGTVKKLIVQSNVLPNSPFRQAIKLLFSDMKLDFLAGVVKSSQDRILDVGCGNGMKFLYPLFESGFKNVLGCDPFVEDNIQYPSGLKIVKKDLFKVENRWDIICFNHSFEHIDNPLQTLQKTNELMDDEGCCIIRIPTSSSYAWRHYRTNWFQLDAPRHTFLHSVESIEHLANQTGFLLEDVVYDSTHHQFTISERYKSGKTMKERTYNSPSGKLAHTFRKFSYAAEAKRRNKMKDGDQAIFYLRKK